MRLENKQFKVEFDEQGGEIFSVFHKDLKIEYMYQGDSKYWSGKNPTLFPMVGNTYSKEYLIDGKTYAMKNHGLVRYSKLEGRYVGDSVVFTLVSSTQTLLQYPFEFKYQIIYELIKDGLKVSYRIKNTDNKVMPFTFGLHPGFRCPLNVDEDFTDYTFHFEKEENCLQRNFQQKGYQSVTVQDIPMDYALFEEQPTLVYKGIQSSKFTLSGKQHGVTIDTSESELPYPLLALWTPKRGAPFVCIEPWYATGDLVENNIDFYHREGTILLESKEEFHTTYQMIFF